MGRHPMAAVILHITYARTVKLIQLIRIACWITKATNTHSENVTDLLIALPLQQ
jgi:hypothetical protein